MFQCPYHLSAEYAMAIHGGLGPWPNEESAFFCNMSGAAITASGVNNCLRRIGQVADIREEEELFEVGRASPLRPQAFTGHSLRRTGAR